MNEESQWLSAYARDKSPEAFAHLVDRYINIVYSAAVRQLNDSHLAEDVTQAVFLILSTKARSISPHAPLIGWLLRTTQYACANAQLARRRRNFHEQKAAEMKPELIAPSDLGETSSYLDVAMGELSRKDHDSIAMKYFAGMSTQEIASLTGVTESAARKRLSRAFDRLRKSLLRRGVTASDALFSAAMALQQLKTASPALRHTIVTRGISTNAKAIALSTARSLARPLRTSLVATAALIVCLVIVIASAATRSTKSTAVTTTISATIATNTTEPTPVPDAANLSFFTAVAAGDLDTVRGLLDQYPALLESRPRGKILHNWDSGTALTAACWENHSEMVKLLIEYGADLESVDPDFGSTALAWCAWFGRVDAAKILLEAGADANHPNRNGAPPIAVARLAQTRKFTTPDQTATIQDRIDMIKLLQSRRAGNAARPPRPTTTKPVK